MLSFKNYLLEAKAEDVRKTHPHLAHLSNSILSSYGEHLGKITLPTDNPDEIEAAIVGFHNNKNNLSSDAKDIGNRNKYKSLADIKDAVNQATAKQESKKAIEELYNDGKTQINHVKTRDACVNSYGGGKTRWCVAVSGKNNLFNRYGKDDKKMFTIHHNGEIYGIHEHEMGTIRNANDESVYPSDAVYRAMAKVPALAKINIFSKNPHTPPEHFDAIFKSSNPDLDLIHDALTHHSNKIKSEHISKIIKNYPISRFIQPALIDQQENITPKHIDMVINHPDEHVISTALLFHKNKIEPKHIDKLFNRHNLSTNLIRIIFKNHRNKVTDSHIAMAAKQGIRLIRRDYGVDFA